MKEINVAQKECLSWGKLYKNARTYTQTWPKSFPNGANAAAFAAGQTAILGCQS